MAERSARLPADRVRQRQRRQDAAAARPPRDPAAYVPVDIARRTPAALGRGAWPRLPGAARCCPSAPTSPGRSQLPRSRPTAAPPGRLLPRLDHRQLHARTRPSALLRQTARLCGPGGGLLLGVDLEERPARSLDAAYNDRPASRPRSTCNLLVRINRELGADFDSTRSAHHAFYNSAAGPHRDAPGQPRATRRSTSATDVRLRGGRERSAPNIRTSTVRATSPRWRSGRGCA